MKPAPKSPHKPSRDALPRVLADRQVRPTALLAFGAHPDDIEFGCGGIIAAETQADRAVHLVVCSRGESGTHGTPKQRVAEAKKAATLLGATIEFLQLDGDAHLEVRATHAIKLAAVIRRIQPGVVLAPSLVENQHPDHSRLGQLVRDACRLARYGGIRELQSAPSHAIDQLFYYAVTAEAEPTGITPVLIDVSAPDVLKAWTDAMEAHGSQISARNYVELQLTRARLRGLRAGISHAIALFPNDPIVLDSLPRAGRASRKF
jgi:LmbE family N-acetylglucosaminyl deacetylase